MYMFGLCKSSFTKNAVYGHVKTLSMCVSVCSLYTIAYLMYLSIRIYANFAMFCGFIK